MGATSKRLHAKLTKMTPQKGLADYFEREGIEPS